MSNGVNFGGSSRKMEILLIVSLGVIIAGSLFFAIRSLMGPGEPKVVGDGLRHYKCSDDTCGEEFTMTEEQMRQAERENRSAYTPGIASFRVVCPKCKKMTGLPESQCPSCHKWFPAPDPALAANHGGGPMPGNVAPGPAATNICPHCGIDIRKWYDDEYEKRGHQ